MALFTDNDRSKVDEEINLEDTDVVDETPDDEVVDDTPDEEVDETPDDEPNDDPDEKPKAKPEDTADYWKTKFQESSREAQIIAEREREAKEKLEEATKPKEVTDETMKKDYPDWDNYDEGVKKALKNQAMQAQELAKLQASQSEYHNERKWRGQIDGFLDENNETEKYPIAGKEAEFRKFVNKPERKGMDLDVLAAAFVYEVGSSKPVKEKPKKKGSMLESGSGAGATGKHKTDKKELTADDAKRLRENNPREYERKVRSGELDLKL